MICLGCETIHEQTACPNCDAPLYSLLLKGPAMHCREHNYHWTDHEGSCPHCDHAREDFEAECNLFASIINDRSGESFSDKWGGTGERAHDYELTGDSQADFLLRFSVNLHDDAKRQLAADLIHLAVGLLSGGLAGTAEAVASKMVREAATYFEHEQQTEKRKAS